MCKLSFLQLHYLHTRASHIEGDCNLGDCLQLVQELATSDNVKGQWKTYEVRPMIRMSPNSISIESG